MGWPSLNILCKIFKKLEIFICPESNLRLHLESSGNNLPLEMALGQSFAFTLKSGWFCVTGHQRRAEKCGLCCSQIFPMERLFPLPLPAFSAFHKASARAGLVCLGRCLFNPFL